MIIAQQQAASKSPARPFAAAAGGNAAGVKVPYGHRFVVEGRVDGAHQILFDNQVFDGRIGYRVWTPVVLGNGTRVLVDRGWVPLGPEGRAEPPNPNAPTGRVRLTGLWRDLPQPGLRLSDDRACEQEQWPRVLNYPTFSQLQCQYTAPVAKGLLLLDENDSRGFARDWHVQLERMPPVRHFGYAAQWFAMAFAVVVIFLIVNLRRIR